MAPATIAERPLPLRTGEVLAVLDGLKTQHRVPVLPHPPERAGDIEPHESYPGEWFYWIDGGDRSPTFRSPLGSPGALLWVQEPYWTDRRDPDGTVIYDATPEIGKYRNTGEVVRSTFFDDRPVPRDQARAAMLPKFWSRHPAETMPRWASRITLEIVEVRCERLNSISPGDARAEGIPEYGHEYRDGLTEHELDHWRNRTTVENFGYVWDERYGPEPLLAWEENPWAWTYLLRCIERGK